MDVLLDSNIYWQDLHMRRNAFQELFAYLKRTGSTLVVPFVVFYELSERYRRELTEAIKQSNEAFKHVRGMAITSKPTLTSPIVNREVRALKDRLRKPAPGIQSFLYFDLHGVEAREVAWRGIRRIRPASDQGEELRDVVLWLSVLEYAKMKKSVIAFVSEDGGFSKANSSGLHQTLQKDIEEASVNILFYKGLPAFVSGNALAKAAVTAEWLKQHISDENILAFAAKGLKELREIRGKSEVHAVNFKHGQKYEVGKDAYFVEAEFEGNALWELSTPTFVLNSNLMAPNVGPSEVFPGTLPFLNPYATYQQQPYPISAVIPGTGFNVGSTPLSGSLFGTPFQDAWRAIQRQTKHEVDFQMQISLRVENEKARHAQLDWFKVGATRIIKDETT